MVLSVITAQIRGAKPQMPLSPDSTSTVSAIHEPPEGSPVTTMNGGGLMHPHQNLRAAEMEGQDSPVTTDPAIKTEPHSGPPSSDEPTRKRRRSRKGLDKRFECTAEGCGKSYSRAEHLYRHQLNHNSKQVFHCEYPDCARTFVRGDLLKRHMDRHTAKGSQLSRRDSVISHVSQSATGTGSVSPDINRATPTFSRVQPQGYFGSHDPLDGSCPPVSNHDALYQFATHQNGVSGRELDAFAHAQSYRSPHSPVVASQGGPESHVSYPISSPVINYDQRDTDSPSASQFIPPQHVVPLNIGPSQFTEGSAHESVGNFLMNATEGFTEADMLLFGNMPLSGTVPMLGNEGDDTKSPYSGLPEDFLEFLFNSTAPGTTLKLDKEALHAAFAELNNNRHRDLSAAADTPSLGLPVSQHIMAVNSLLDRNLPEATISDEKSQEIFDFIKERFHEPDDAPPERRRGNILEGDRNEGDHMLSKRMMQAYIGSYWVHFSDQMPILHKPTFLPNNSPNLLLLSMMIIGAALLDRTHGPKVVKAGAQLSNFLAWHLRWEIFMESNFHPPAKLWIFQALILLELYEKMYSTRELHERAHIHHATTIQLMRRGRSLIGKSAMDSPTPLDSVNGSRHSSLSGVTQTAEEWWDQWITNEATRRAAFAAFIVDSMHSTMFGHSGAMVAHELRLPLPCNDSLWRATSSAEVGRMEANLLSQGHKPPSFLEGVKRTLNGQEVHTSSFGRNVLMAGLLSVTWHMHQRDLQVSMLGVSATLGSRDKWRSTLTRAYDSWKNDFDRALRQSDARDPYRSDAAKREAINVKFENRTVLHRLAHMAMHADIVDLQMFARARRLLGRGIGPHEFNAAERRIRYAWAPSARARDAAWYSIKYMCSVFIPDAVAPTHAGARRPEKPYRAKDDVLLNRPWVLYFGALVVWCYSYALEGPPDTPPPATHQEKMQQMRDYLLTYGSIKDPVQLRAIHGLNRNTALLMVLKDTFEETRWELLHEASILLNNCITLNSGNTC